MHLPEPLIAQLTEHSSCFLLFYFDADGNPCYIENFPEYKDSMAIQKMVIDYVNSDGQMGKQLEENDDE